MPRLRLLIVTAVPAERDAVRAGLPPGGAPAAAVLAGGVGPAAAAARTATALATEAGSYDLVVSAGIGGGFPPAATPGSTVVASRIVAADLGAQVPPDHAGAPGAPGAEAGTEADDRTEGFRSVAELGFGTDRFAPPAPLAEAVADALGAVCAPVLSVCTVTGTAERAAALRARHPQAAAEAMEGFGVAQAAALHDLPVLEIRTISNVVGPRDRSAWRIPAALAALTDAFARLAPVLDQWQDGDLG